MSRDFGGFRQGLFFKLEQIIASHGAKLAYPTQVIATIQLVHLQSTSSENLSNTCEQNMGVLA